MSLTFDNLRISLILLLLRYAKICLLNRFIFLNFLGCTDAEHLSDLLVAEGLVDGYESEEFGYTITAVDGIYLDWAKDNAYWALYEGDAYATESAAGIVLVDGAVYRLVYESF